MSLSQQALPLYEKFDDTRAQVALHEQIGKAQSELGQRSQADAWYNAALELIDRSDLHLSTASLWMKRAALATRQNRWADAAAYYEQARLALDPGTPSADRIALLFQRGDAALHAHDWSTADASYNDALESQMSRVRVRITGGV